ncbi:putative RNA-directed DNA polymerase from transposon X-element [Fusarium oxysporum f. sp. rapae]|uniref:Putative RNA-directed DNA polymerase from transposon X-element n=2 Tax=Fusarium oxysporum f. sp. rapae TaxID=485398 RepID=A0A8J5P4C3_FUSOX|nr:putative RNA-directed DNA polymerase from transposon X-element [Fusarium oxysporum f. sp. rapae]
MVLKTTPCWHKITPEKFQRHLKPRLPPLDSSVGTEEQVVDLFAKVIHALHVTTMENVPRRFCGLRPQAQRLKKLASKLRKPLAELDTFRKKLQTLKTLQRISFLERDLDGLNAEMWNVSNHDKTRRPSPRKLFNVFRLASGKSQPIQFPQTPTLEYKGDHHSDSDAANETQLATTDQEKIEMIKKVKFRNNDNPESKRILDEPGPRHDPQREYINMPRDINAEKLRTIIKGLQNNKAPGPYRVPNEAIRLGMELLLPYFLLGFRVYLNLLLHPVNFRDSIIVMLLKVGKEADKPKSYRPISLLSSVGKLYKRILADMMLDVLKENPHLLPVT